MTLPTKGLRLKRRNVLMSFQALKDPKILSVYILYYTIPVVIQHLCYSKTINTVLIARNFEAFYKNTGSPDKNHNNSCYVMFILYRVIRVCDIYMRISRKATSFPRITKFFKRIYSLK